jgi:peptide chain release factor 1
MRERLEQFCYTRKDFRIEWFSGTGPGGQNRNKVQTCVRITHVPSGLKIVSQRHRTRTANFREAFQSLGQKIKAWVEQQISRDHMRRTSDETIRTYHFADNRVVDHASGHRIPARELDKRFGELIEARKKTIEVA